MEQSNSMQQKQLLKTCCPTLIPWDITTVTLLGYLGTRKMAQLDQKISWYLSPQNKEQENYVKQQFSGTLCSLER